MSQMQPHDRAVRRPPLPFPKAAARIISCTVRGDVRRAVHMAAGSEGQKAWPLLIFQIAFISSFLGVIREGLLKGNPGLSGGGVWDSVLRGFLLAIESFVILFILLRLMAVITRSGMKSRSLLSLMAAAALPLTAFLAIAAVSAVFLPAIAVPAAVLGIALALIVLYMGLEYAAIMVKVKSFGCFTFMMMIYFPLVSFLGSQLMNAAK